jgi:uncharacterized protein
LLKGKAKVKVPARPTTVTSIDLAANYGHTQVVHALIEAGAPLNPIHHPTRESALHYAVLGDYHDIAVALLEAGADVNFRAHGGRGDTPLHAAAHLNKVAMVDLLLKYNADISIAVDDGMTALDLAKQQGADQVVSRLIRHMEL